MIVYYTLYSLLVQFPSGADHTFPIQLSFPPFTLFNSFFTFMEKHIKTEAWVHHSSLLTLSLSLKPEGIAIFIGGTLLSSSSLLKSLTASRAISSK